MEPRKDTEPHTPKPWNQLTVFFKKSLPNLHTSVLDFKKKKRAGQQWRMPLIPALGRQRQVDL